MLIIATRLVVIVNYRCGIANTSDNLHSIREAAKISDLCTKQQIAELSKGKEDDHEHDHEPNNILFSFAESAGELGHCLIKAHILEHLQTECICMNNKPTECIIKYTGIKKV